MYSPHPSPGPRGGDRDRSDSLGAYLAEIGEARVLTRVEEQALARRFRRLRAEVHALLAGIPFTARVLAEGRHAPGGIAHPFHGRAGGTDAGRTARLARVERRLRRLPPLVRAGSGGSAWERFEARQRRDLLALDLSPDFYREIEARLRIRLHALDAARRYGERSRARRLRDEVGLPVRRFRRRMAELAAAAERRDRARNELAHHNLKLVVRFAKQYRNLGVAFHDLIQEANVGLLRAVELFDPDRGLKFSTYAVWWIRQALVRGLQRHSRSVRLPSHVAERLHRLGRAATRLEGKLGRRPTSQELGRDLCLDAEQVEQLSSFERTPLSLDRAPDPDGSALHERLADAGAPNPVDELDGERQQRLVGGLLSRLEPREQAVIAHRFGLVDGESSSLEGLAQELGISREFVRRIESRALSKLRHWAEEGVEETERGVHWT